LRGPGQGARVPKEAATRRLTILGALGAALLTAGCGSSSSSSSSSGTGATGATGAKRAASPVCLPKAVDAVARYLDVAPGSISLTKQTGNNAMPQCSLRAHPAHAPGIHLIANVYDGPQPYFVLERTAVEAGQQFTDQRMIAAPVTVSGLGLDADWFPAEKQLMSTDGKRLITVTVDWHGVPAARQRAIARAALAPYLQPKRQAGKGAPG
jgi:hypothetical protein